MAIEDTLGLKFPFSFGQLTLPDTVQGVDVLASSLKSLLLTGAGEVPMNPTLGMRIHEMIFKPVTPILKARIIKEIRDVIAVFEPRVRVLSVRIQERMDVETGLWVDVVYEADGIENEFGMPLGQGV